MKKILLCVLCACLVIFSYGHNIDKSNLQTKTNLQTSIEYIKKFEGFSSTAKKDSRGYSVGYGFNFIDGKRVQKGQTITKAQADKQIVKIVLQNRKHYQHLVEPQYLFILDSFAYQYGLKKLNNIILNKKVNCPKLLKYKYVNKVDCSKSNSCKGVYNRSLFYYNKCLEIK